MLPKEHQELKRTNAAYMSTVSRDFLTNNVPKDKIESPGPGSYIKPEVTAKNTKTLEQAERDKTRYMKNNPFGKGDVRFEYQKQKIDREREVPTGDFNVHMPAVLDRDVEKKRDAI